MRKTLALLALIALPFNAAAEEQAKLQQRLSELLVSFGPHAGIAVRDVKAGWTAHANGFVAFPQQSAFKTWVAVAVLRAVDEGTLRWDEPLKVTEADLEFPYQPIAREVKKGKTTFTTEELVRWMVTLSDNPATDVLIRRLGGVEAVSAALKRAGVKEIKVEADERGLHEHGRRLSASVAKDALPAQRDAAVQKGIASSPNLASPMATVRALAALQRGELLSAQSTSRLLAILEETVTGAGRLPAGLGQGWKIGHKTGTGGDVDGATTGTNDAGLLTAPDGRVYAVAVFIAGSRRSVKERDGLSADVARAVVEHWVRTRPAK